MRSWHERLRAAATTGQRAAASRRRLLAAGIGAASGAVVGGPGSLGSMSSAQSEAADDVTSLNLALRLERIEAVFYRQGLGAFDAAAFAAANRPDPVRPSLEAIADQEQVHVQALTAAIRDLGGTPAPAERHDLRFAGVGGFLATAAALENAVAGALAGVAPSIRRRSSLAALLGVLAVDARHAGYLNGVIGQSQFPNAVDQPLSPEDALAEIARLLPETAREPTTAAPATPAPAGTAPADAADRRRFADLIADAATRQGVDSADVAIVEVRSRDWPDASLGCPEPGGIYAQVVTPGYLVVVEAGGARLEYHTDRRGRFVHCS